MAVQDKKFKRDLVKKWVFLRWEYETMWTMYTMKKRDTLTLPYYFGLTVFLRKMQYKFQLLYSYYGIE